jgi:hypothetical protein
VPEKEPVFVFEMPKGFVAPNGADAIFSDRTSGPLSLKPFFHHPLSLEG